MDAAFNHGTLHGERALEELIHRQEPLQMLSANVFREILEPHLDRFIASLEDGRILAADQLLGFSSIDVGLSWIWLHECSGLKMVIARVAGTKQDQLQRPIGQSQR